MTLQQPNLDRLLVASSDMARAMGLDEPGRSRTSAFLRELLHKSQRDGGRDLWGCFVDGLITRDELRNAVMARLSTHFCALKSVAELSCDGWLTNELERAFDAALFG